MTDTMEVKKDGLSQLQDGCWKLTLKVHPDNMHSDILSAPMGQRYAVAMVPVFDGVKEVAEGGPIFDDGYAGGKPDKPKTAFNDMPRAQQAGILCADERFQDWLGVSDSDGAAQAVRFRCGVSSRAELDGFDPAEIWDEEVSSYRLATGQVAEQR